MRASAAVAAACVSVTLAADKPSGSDPKAPKAESNESSSDPFSPTTVHQVHLTFSADQWTAMEPAGGSGMPGRGPAIGGFGPGTFLGPAFLKHADQDNNGRIGAEEFTGLAAKWFEAWDKDSGNGLSADELRTGLNAAFAPPAGPNPQGAAPRMPGLNLLGAAGKRNGLASAMGIEFSYVHGAVDFNDRHFADAAVRYKGNGTFLQSRSGIKRSLKIDLNKFAKGENLAGTTTLNLHSNVTDPSGMNEVLSFRLYRDAAVAAPRTAYARVHLTVPGKYDKKYLGLYSLVENPGDNFLKKNFGSAKGALFKPVTPTPFVYLGDDWSKYEQIYDPKEALSLKHAQRLIEFCKLVSNADDSAFAGAVGKFIDLDQAARYFAVTVWLSTMDSILTVGQNYYIYLHPTSEKFSFIPWDLDHSFGQFPLVGSQSEREQLSIDRPWRGENRFLERLFAVPAFKDLYRGHLEQFSKTLFRPERFEEQVDQIGAAIRTAVAEESEDRLARLEKAVAGETTSAPAFPGFNPPPPAEPQSPGATGDSRLSGGGPRGFGSGTKPIKAFVRARAQAVAEQLAGKARGETLSESSGFRNPQGFGPGTFLGPAWVEAFDLDKDKAVTRDEMRAGFSKWFGSWDADRDGALAEEELRAGLNRDSRPPAGPSRFPRGAAPVEANADVAKPAPLPGEAPGK